MVTMNGHNIPSASPMPMSADPRHRRERYAYAAFEGGKCVGVVAILPPGEGAETTAEAVSEWILAGHQVKQVAASIARDLIADAMGGGSAESEGGAE